MIACTQDGQALSLVPHHLRTYELCKIAVSNDSYVLDFVPVELLTEDLFIAAIKYGNKRNNNEQGLARIPAEYRSYVVCLEAIKSNPLDLKYVPYGHITYEMCLLVVRANPCLISIIPTKFLNEELAMIAITKDPITFRYLPLALLKNMKLNDNILIDMVKDTPYVIQHIPQDVIQISEYLWLEFIKLTDRALMHCCNKTEKMKTLHKMLWEV